MKTRLANGRSPSWALMERFVVPDYDSDDDYLTRWRVVQTPWFGVYLHKIGTPDPRPTLHDHPWPFLAVVLRGGYDEMRRDGHEVHTRHGQAPAYARRRTVRRLNVMPLDALHWIDRLHRVPTWTLVFVGRRQRVWGYLDRDGTWTSFDRHPHAAEFDAALARRRR